MILKLIRCVVPVSLRPVFHRAQARGWRKLAHVAGFVAQIGGWDWLDPDRAVVLGIWEDVEAYDRFMAADHDRMVVASGQAATYQSLEVELLRVIEPTTHDAAAMAAAIRSAAILVLDSRVDAVDPEPGALVSLSAEAVADPERKLTLGLLGGDRSRARDVVRAGRDRSRRRAVVLDPGWAVIVA